MAGKKKRVEGPAGDPWARAAKLCRLDARQIQMARELGMNPKKLPGLIPSRSQSWKAPVGVFIEDLHAERFGVRDATPRPGCVDPRPRPARSVPDPVEVVVHLANLGDDLSQLATHHGATRDVLLAVAADLRRVADEIEGGRSVGQLPCADLIDRAPEDLPSTPYDPPFLDGDRPVLDGDLPF